MNVAIPINQNCICKEFAQSETFVIYDVEIELVQSRIVIERGTRSMEQFLSDAQIHAVICDQIDSKHRVLLRTKRIELTYGVTGIADDVMISYLSGECLGIVEENKLLHRKQQLYHT